MVFGTARLFFCALVGFFLNFGIFRRGRVRGIVVYLIFENICCGCFLGRSGGK